MYIEKVMKKIFRIKHEFLQNLEDIEKKIISFVSIFNLINK